MFKVNDVPVGSNLTLINVSYRYSRKNEKTGKRDPDCAIIIYRDNETGKKYSHTIFGVPYTWYLAKPGVHTFTGQHFIDENDVIPITCRYSEVTRSIAKEVGQLEIFENNLRNGEFRLNRTFFMHPRAFAADIPIKNYLRLKFSESYQNPVVPITKFYFDTEADIINAVSDNVMVGECPTIMITGYFTGNDTMYSMMVRNNKNKQIRETENKISALKNLDLELHRIIVENIGLEKTKKFGLDKTHLRVAFFDTELEMLLTFFDLIKKLQPDMVMAWNAFGYDYKQIIERIKSHGISPEKVVCDRRIKPSYFHMYIDEKNANKPEERTDYIDCTSFSVFLDQEILYASRRKGQSASESLALDYIASKEAGIHKKDYHEITTNIAKFPWLAYETFWHYNIIDVVCQKAIDVATSDVDYMFNNATQMCTPYDKIFRQTNFLWTKAVQFYKSQGFIIGDNANRFNQAPSDKFPGAFVASPLLLTDKNKIKCNGRAIMKFTNANDYDYKALYPSLLREFNMAPHTQVGMIEFMRPPYRDEDYLRIEPGGTFNENLASHNYIEFCHRWLGLANVDEMLEDLDKYFSVYRTPLSRGIEGQLRYDLENKIVAYKTDKSKIVHVNRPIPQWVSEEVNKHRSTIRME